MARPLKFRSVEELQEKIDAYFKKCDDGEKIEVYDKKKQEVLTYTRKIPYTITGLALELDTSRQTLMNYTRREEFFDTIKRAKLRCENYCELRAITGDVPPAGPIFILKNYGWKDKTEHDVNVKSIDDLVKEIEDEEN